MSIVSGKGYELLSMHRLFSKLQYFLSTKTEKDTSPKTAQKSSETRKKKPYF